MKKNACLYGMGLFMFFLTIQGVSLAQTDKKAAELKKLEAGITVARNNVAKNEKLLVVADSLISNGTDQMNESKAETKSIAAERKKLDKDYATRKKPLNKLVASNDKTEVTQGKADLKALDTQYKTDVKALDIRLREATKKSTTGTSNLTKGKTSKKAAEEGLKTTQAALDAAQAKYDAAAGVGEGGGEVKKKKK
jgi:NaMN:DMB phosphoribosyltransferase